MINPFKHGLTGEEAVIVEDMTVGDLSKRLKCSVSSLIVFLISRGILANKNQLLKKDQIISFLADLGVKFNEPDNGSEAKIEQSMEIRASSGSDERLPVVAVVGHVDHGKTSFLDYLRKTTIASKEYGGITQNIAAYEVPTQYGNLVFLDTPGHEAFSLMRERGVLMADLVLLIVALDDGVKPQTVESIKKIQESGATAVVALNKVDKVSEDRLDIVKRELSDYGILPDEWGGDVPVLPISAKTGKGINDLLEVLRLQADILDLKTTTKGKAEGVVLESFIEHGRGAVASVILHKGTICRGDSFICGKASGKVSSMRDSYGKNLKCAGPSVPVNIAGFSLLPVAGDIFEFATSSEAKKHKNRSGREFINKKMTNFSEARKDEISIILRAGTVLSKEALLESLKKLSLKIDAKIKIIDSAVGDINEGSLDLAVITGATIYGLGVRVDKSALSRVRKPVDVKIFNIIYKLLEDIEAVHESKQGPVIIEEILGTAKVKAIFKIKNIGTVAGAGVETGLLEKGMKVRILRDGEKIGGGIIKTLQRDRSAASSVSSGKDCAFAVDEFSKWEIGDIVQCYKETIEKKA